MEKGMSICTCGHVGDCPTTASPNYDRAQRVGKDSQHGGLVGHGPCYAHGCDCKKFTWVKYLPGRD